MVYGVCLLQLGLVAWPGVKKTGFVYADAQTVHLARLTYHTLFSLSIVKRKHPDDLHKMIGNRHF